MKRYRPVLFGALAGWDASRCLTAIAQDRTLLAVVLAVLTVVLLAWAFICEDVDPS